MQIFFTVALVALGYILKAIIDWRRRPRRQGNLAVKHKLDRFLSSETPHTRYWLLIEMGLDRSGDRKTLHSLLHRYEEDGVIETIPTPEGPAYRRRVKLHTMV